MPLLLFNYAGFIRITLSLISSSTLSIIFKLIFNYSDMLFILTTLFFTVLLYKYIFNIRYYIGEYGIAQESVFGVVEIYFKDIRFVKIVEDGIDITYKHSNKKIGIPIEAGKILNECENFPLKIKNI